MNIYSADGVLLTDGMRVWDNNLQLCTVDLSTARPEANGDYWFMTKALDGTRGALLNGDRVTRTDPHRNNRHPLTDKTKWDYLNGDQQDALEETPCDLTCGGCGTYHETEADFAKHYLIEDSRYLNLGYCPNRSNS